MSIKSLLAIAATGVLMVSTAQAGELDRVQSAPAGLVVRENSAGVKEVFRVDGNTKITNDEQAAAVAVDSNKIATGGALSELDRTSSSESWFWYWGGGWGYPYYGYYWGGYYNYYNPYYYGGWYGGYRYSYWCW